MPCPLQQIINLFKVLHIFPHYCLHTCTYNTIITLTDYYNVLLIQFLFCFYLQIKVYDPSNKTCTTLAGTGESGLQDGSLDEAKLSEPGGLCVVDNGRALLVADTNNHCIRIIDLQGKTITKVSKLNIAI